MATTKWKRLLAVVALASVGAAGALWAQTEVVEPPDRMMPIAGNPDGTLKCKRGCGTLDPCC